MSSPTPFAWVHKRDGRLVPFDADRISRALFAAGESLGQPDAFASRELTDSILHFLSADAAGSTPTTAQIAELVVKVVRELGQPALAKAFADAQTRKAESGKQAEEDQRQSAAWKGSTDGWTPLPDFRSMPATTLGPTPIRLARWVEALPAPTDLAWRLAEACLHDYALREVYTRDLVAVQADGLLTLTGLTTPLELTAQVLGIAGPGRPDLVEAMEEARSLAGEYVAVDGTEYLLARRGPAQEAVPRFVRELAIALRLLRLQAILNLNCALPPPWAETLAEGPLFGPTRQGGEAQQSAEFLEPLLESLLGPDASGLAMRLDWHLGDRDFVADKLGGLLRLARRALEGAPLAFVFDRVRRPVALGEGLDRHHPAVLLAVGLHLPRLLEQSGSRIDVPLFLRKLDSLARLALSAATQKRDFLRRQRCGRPNVNRGFVLDRARLLAVPVGLESVTQTLLGRSVASGGAAREFAQQVVHRLQTVLSEDGRARMLDICVDSALGYRLASAGAEAEGVFASKPVGDAHAEQGPTVHDVAGLTPWDPTAAPKDQLVAGGALHGAAGTGTLSLLIPEERPLSPEELVQFLRFAWQQTEITRIRLVRTVAPQRQLTAPWEKTHERAMVAFEQP